MKVISYQRVSTQGQDLHRQQTLVKNYCTQNGYELVKVFQEKISGAKTDREELNALLQCTKEDADLVVVSELSRITRNESEYYKILNVIAELKEKGLDVVFLDKPHQIYKHDEQFTLTQLIELICEAKGAADERSRKHYQCLSGMKDKAANNPYMVIGSTPSLGFKAITNPLYIKNHVTKNCRTILAIDEDQATSVKMIYEMAINGKSAQTICDYLNATGIKNNRGQRWYSNTILQMIHNPIYKGERTLYGITYKIEPIVSPSVWEKANKAISTRRCTITKKTDRYNPLKGLFYCHDCGLPMSIVVGKRGLYYKCLFQAYKERKLDIIKDKECNNSQVFADLINSTIWDICKEYLKSDEYYRASNMTYADYQHQRSKLDGAWHDMAEEIKAIRDKKRKIEKRLIAYADDEIMVEMLNASFAKVSTELEEIRKQMLQNEKECVKIESKMKELKKQIPNKKMTIQEKSEFYHQIIDRIEWAGIKFKKVGTLIVKFKNGTQVNRPLYIR